MKAVGIKALKARLSEYIRMARAGETILVTDRDEVVAELRPARRQPVPPSSLDEALQNSAERGEATLHSRPPASLKLEPLPGGPLPVSAAELLDELRADRN
ncbi:MAG: type II toxin-antitoxin system Phd/YefM family antitoxin [Phycisphaerae bacterium]|nr:prevent-host-death protein [Phycisphaerae bacterium]NUQ46150.1 type II toxin-antitoxin system Phd/YefM family antitoxin [Phycisphaerae bacterium]